MQPLQFLFESLKQFKQRLTSIHHTFTFRVKQQEQWSPKLTPERKLQLQQQHKDSQDAFNFNALTIDDFGELSEDESVSPNSHPVGAIAVESEDKGINIPITAETNEKTEEEVEEKNPLQEDGEVDILS